MLIADPVPVVSFTFGCPTAEVGRSLQEAGSAVVVTVTCPEEAAVAVAAGADGLCAQGVEAGAHRGRFTDDDTWRRDYRLLDLLDALGAGDVAVLAARPLRAPAAGRGDTETMSLWAGEGYAQATDRAAGEIVEWLCSGSESASGS